MVEINSLDSVFSFMTTSEDGHMTFYNDNIELVLKVNLNQRNSWTLGSYSGFVDSCDF